LHHKPAATRSHLREKYNSSDCCPKCIPGSSRAPRCSNLLCTLHFVEYNADGSTFRQRTSAPALASQ
jgi:hypothetical protein